MIFSCSSLDCVPKTELSARRLKSACEAQCLRLSQENTLNQLQSLRSRKATVFMGSKGVGCVGMAVLHVKWPNRILKMAREGEKRT